MTNEFMNDVELQTVKEEDSIHVPWARFSQWLHCVCVVTFDLELGQAMEFKYPKEAAMSEKERSNICYLAFPDSNSGCMGDTQYCFRIRKTSHPPDYDDSDVASDFPAVLQKDNTHYYGYVYFRQVRDKTLKRGYFQKSVVLLSKLPYFTFFREIAEIIAPEYFDHGEACLETACHDIDRWPKPGPGRTFNLPLMGTVLRIRIPSKQDKPGQSNVDDSQVQTLQYQYTILSIHEIDIIRYFQPVLMHCHLLWELVLLGEPLVVISTSPDVCSSTVLSLISSISPLRYHCDYRPFFTIHDSEFKEYTSRTQAPPRVLLGVTNPFFTKTLQHYPHIIRIGDLGLPTSSSTPSLLSSDKLRKASKMKTFDTKPGVYTEYKVFLKKDKAFFKSMAKAGHRFTADDSSKLRRHFLELTQSFMIPLERYMASLMPLQKNISPLRAPPVLKPFRPEEFLSTVDSQGPHLTSVTRGNWSGLYRKFFQSPNFVAWLTGRRLEMENKITALHLKGLSEMDLVEWCQDKSEVEIVDMVLRLRRKINLVMHEGIDVAQDSVEKLRAQLGRIIGTLPEDLRSVLNAA